MKNLVFIFALVTSVVQAQQAPTATFGASGVGHVGQISCSAPAGGGICTTDDKKAVRKTIFINYAHRTDYEYDVTVGDDCSKYRFNHVGKSNLYVNEPGALQNPGFDAFSFTLDNAGTSIMYQAPAIGEAGTGLLPITYHCVSH